MTVLRDLGKSSLIALAGCLLAAAPQTVLSDGGFAKVSTMTGQWEPMARSPRSEALGGADMAVAAGPFATLTNVAPLPEGGGADLGYCASDFFSFWDIDLLGGSVERGPWRFSAVAIFFSDNRNKP